MNLLRFSLSDTLANIKSSDIFLKSMGVDIANNSQRPLMDVLAEKHIDKDKATSILSLLHDLPAKDSHWLLEPTSHLIDHIKNQYHVRHRQQLPLLVSLARKVEESHATHPHCPTGLADLLGQLHQDLLAHMDNEEQLLFEFLAEQKNPPLFSQVSLAMHSHDHEVYLLRKMDELTNNITLPKTADAQWKNLYLELKKFKEELEEHIRLENDVLFEMCS